MSEKITIEAQIRKPRIEVWILWTEPTHIIQWNQASDDWHTPSAQNDLTAGGRFQFRMEAKDGSAGFDFTGIYDEVIPNEKIAYTMEDGRKVEVVFFGEGDETNIVTTFEAESTHSIELQRAGWQSILDNFKKYAESRG